MGVVFEMKSCENQQTVSFESPIGTIKVTLCLFGLHRLSLVDHLVIPNKQIKVKLMAKDVITDELIDKLNEWLSAYFECRDQQLDTKQLTLCPIFTSSTPEFYRKVWLLLKNNVKFGQTISYSDLAAETGSPGASRAVGSAMKSNPIPLVVPCHRVIRKDGSFGHYSAGSGHALKEWLLNHEMNTSNN
ncbi:methylated-DNA--protein-cysteine methyltransferase-like [Oppia nitens]|uniref:methylated-DNA--protein-cysteine methyltransferase-like n=1 Tax=Oppia nitens TaxID=1686743 RepID=UPI0023DC5875|nr:methylated-DNA--protein-cysteine methyltransferase-like [Oppia nitens]